MSKRVTIDFNDIAASELDRLKTVTGLTTADVFRYSLALLRIYVKAKQDGHEMRIFNEAEVNVQSRIEFPIIIERA